MKHFTHILVATAICFVGGCVSFHGGPLPGEPADATFATIDDTRVHYVEMAPAAAAKDAPVAVLIHGFASSTGVWASVMPEIAQTHRVIALDLKGFGWTSRPPGDYSPRAQAELAWSLVEQLGVDKPVALVAHSWGSSVALQMALMRPAHVDRIALYDAWVYGDQLPSTFAWARVPVLGELIFGAFYKERPDEKMRQAFFDDSYVTYAFAEHIRERMDQPGTAAAALAAVRGQRYEDLESRYGDVEAPTLLLWGREDAVTTLAFGERLLRQLPNARMEVYARSGHFPMIEAEAASTADLIAFLTADSEALR